ncbi:MAG: 23S rRNA (cytosine1962-C5)-methyltransferase [Kiritimatiellia bacterium]|jgi:23S rRNA (cytosine1962-C5)-methyltransferase
MGQRRRSKGPVGPPSDRKNQGSGRGKPGTNKPGAGRDRPERDVVASVQPGRGEWVVNGYSQTWLKKGFPWVYPDEVVSRGKGGGTVLVRGPSGDVLGRAVPDEGWIAARVYRYDHGPIDREWVGSLLDRAAALRELIIDPETTGYRLVNAENDGLAGLRVDVWAHTVVLTLDSPAVAVVVDDVVAWLIEHLFPKAIYLCYRPDPRDDRDFDSVEPAPGLLHGHHPPGDIRVTEHGMGMLVRPSEGPDVGMYADMRAVRRWLEPYWGGRSVLNTFAYTGAFSVAAAMGGAMEVVTVDLSSRYLERAEANFVANDLEPGLYDFLAEDTFKVLDRFRRQGRRFDVVIVDPPSFSHAKEGTWSAKRDFPRLVAAACRVLQSGGWLVAASNHGQTSPRDFRGWISEGARRANVSAQELAWLGQAPDFPAATSFPEGRYLKVGVWRIG